MSVLADIWANEKNNIDPELLKRIENELGLSTTVTTKKISRHLKNGNLAVWRKKASKWVRANGAFVTALGAFSTAAFEFNTILGLAVAGLALLWIDDKVN